MRGTPLERFWHYTEQSSGCWHWTGTVRSGYGRLKVGDKKVTAHRFSYELHVGSIPDGMVLDHLCGNRACVNPAHLEPVTSRVNTLRGDTPASRQLLRTHCPHGHPYSGENLYVWKRNRYCRACNRGRKSGDTSACVECAAAAARLSA